MRNSFSLYVRHAVMLCCGLISISFLIKNLGIEKYGLYLSVWSFVFLLNFLIGTISSTSLRYFSYALGSDTGGNLQKVATNIFLIMLILVIFIVTLALVFGQKLLVILYPHLLDVSESLLYIYYPLLMMLITTIFTGFFSSIVISLEKFQVYAAISIVDALCKMIAAISLSWLGDNNLFIYCCFLAIISGLTSSAYLIYLRSFQQLNFLQSYYIDFHLIKNILRYATWTMFGQSTTTMRVQGLSVVLAAVFKPEVVVARGISLSVVNNLVNFANNFAKSAYPQIIKSWSRGERQEMYSIVCFSTNITFLLVWFICFPLLFFTEYILDIWLGEYPHLAIYFVKLVVVEALITSTALSVMTAGRAPGNIKNFETILGLIQIFAFVIIALLIHIFQSPLIVPIGVVFLTLIMFPVRLILVNKLTGLPWRNFLSQSLLPISLIACTMLFLMYFLGGFLPLNWYTILLLITINIGVSSLILYIFTVRNNAFP